MKRASGVHIVGTGHHLGTIVEDNETLCRHLAVTPEWIIEKTGIERRFLAAAGDMPSEYAALAAERAMAMAGISAHQVDLIIACTFSGDYLFPPLSAKIHSLLGVRGAQTFDVQANCGGFVAGLTAASDRMIVDSSVRHALVIGVEFNSRYVNREDVNSAIYVSDGAGAVVLGRCGDDSGIVSSSFFTDSTNYEAARMRGSGANFRCAGRAFDSSVDYMELNGIATWKQAITNLPPTIRSACRKADIQPQQLDFIIFHQANYRLIEYLVKKMGLSPDRTYTNVQRIGNTGAASVGIALSEAVQLGLLRAGDSVAFAAVGAGFNFGASVWRWGPMGAGDA